MSDATTNGQALVVDFQRITIGDMEDFEEITGSPFMQTLESIANTDVARIPTKVLKALVFLVKRVQDPEFRIEDARDVRVSELVLDLGAAVDPTAAAG